jgi:hypothetical protein
MLERIRWRLASVFASWALGLMRPETSEDGFSIALIRRLGNQSELQIDPQTLSIGAREKLAAAIRQEKTKLQARFDRAVQAEIARAIDETVLPQHNIDCRCRPFAFTSRAASSSPRSCEEWPVQPSAFPSRCTSPIRAW